MNTELLSANHAVALAAARAGQANRFGRGFCSGVYPITPSTECMELLCAQQIDKGHLVRVEGEHSAMAVCIGAAAGGARSFTASSSNGLAYMAENVIAAGLMRLPVVMLAVNRTLGPPWNIWADQGDSLLLRDSGWLQFYCLDNQEVFDSILLAYRIGEDPNILLPAMVCQDAFVLSHTMAQTAIAEQEQVDRFLPPLQLPHRLGAEPRVVGAMASPQQTAVHRRQHHEAMGRVFAVHAQAQEEFSGIFGRRPADPVVPYRLEDAEVVLLAMGTLASTVERAVDAARERGIRAGALRVKMFRPFPAELLQKQLAGKQRIAVLDRNISLGFGGVLWGELRGCTDPEALVQNYILGIGGGDVQPELIEGLIQDMLQRKAVEAPILLEVEP